MPLPIQAIPIPREILSRTPSSTEGGIEPSGCACGGVASANVKPSQTVCDDLTGAARQLCYNLVYGISFF
jgi:hypothetical protein